MYAFSRGQNKSRKCTKSEYINNNIDVLILLAFLRMMHAAASFFTEVEVWMVAFKDFKF